jgi:prolyl-tRNA synthetase
MKWSHCLIPTQRHDPADAVIASHQLMLRAGLIRQLTSGVYDFLPLGLRSLHKAAHIVREEINALGGCEVLLPALQPAELWQTTGRDASYGENLMTFKDRHGHLTVLGPTHEEVVTEMVAASVNSHRQLPLSLYQIQTKFRDEYRPRFGLLRVREFLMMDAYSFHADQPSLDQAYEQYRDAYRRIFARCGIPVVAAEAESGPIGGGESHEFLAPCAAGEDFLVTSNKGNYAANIERAEAGTRPWTFSGAPTGDLEKVHTPNLPSISDVAQFLKVEPRNMLKTLVFHATGEAALPMEPQAAQWVVAVVRGDHDVNEAKLARAAKRHFNVSGIQLVDNDLVRQSWVIGFVGPDAAVRNPRAVVLIDPDAARSGFWVAGANERDYHVKHLNWFRECGERLADPTRVMVADIRNAVEGDPSPRNDGGILTLARAIEVGHTFKIGTRYSQPLNAQFRDDAGQLHPILMGTYGIGIGRILVATVENLHDDRGIVWPAAIAPFSVVLTPIRYEGEAKEVGDRLYEQLNAAGIDTILDDRDARPGVKFNDADLIGFPLRINIGDRGLKEGKVEMKRRTGTAAEMLPLDSVVAAVRDTLSAMAVSRP